MDLRTIVDPKGRVDVAAYRMAEKVVRDYEMKTGMSNLWDGVEAMVQRLVLAAMGGVVVPPEISTLASLLLSHGNKPINPNPTNPRSGNPQPKPTMGTTTQIPTSTGGWYK